MRLSTILASATIGAALLAGSVVSASAAIVCSRNVCWHSSETYTYPRESKVIIHEDNWRWGPKDHYTFRDHEGRAIGAALAGPNGD